MSTFHLVLQLRIANRRGIRARRECARVRAQTARGSPIKDEKKEQEKHKERSERAEEKKREKEEWRRHDIQIIPSFFSLERRREREREEKLVYFILLTKTWRSSGGRKVFPPVGSPLYHPACCEDVSSCRRVNSPAINSPTLTRIKFLSSRDCAPIRSPREEGTYTSVNYSTSTEDRRDSLFNHSSKVSFSP